MIKNYFTVAIRSLLRQKGYFLINILGLTIGLTSCLLIMFYVIDELSYDRYHEKGDRIYRVGYKYDSPNGDQSIMPYTEYKLKPAFETFYNQIEAFVRISTPTSMYIKFADKQFYESNVSMVEKSYFQVFTHEWIVGDPETALSEPFTLVITESMAHKYFGDEDPMNKDLMFITPVGEAPARVTGVIKDMPQNSHYHINIFASMESAPYLYNKMQLNNWGEMTGYSYILMPENVPVDVIQEKGKEFMIERSGENIDDNSDVLLQPLYDIHLHSNARYEIEENGSFRNVVIFSIIAVFILLIASINYMNLATARSTKRSLEVGIRKVMGAGKLSLVLQFMGEAIVLVIVSLIFSLALADLLMPSFNQIAGKEINIVWMNNIWIILLTLLIAIIIGVLSGSYPAFFLSSFQPLAVLKEKVKSSGSSSLLRKILVVSQFSISIILIICTLVVYTQWKYMKNKSLGIDPTNVVILRSPGEAHNETFKNELLQNPQILNVSGSNKRPTFRMSTNMSYTAEGVEHDDSKNIKIITVDYDFFETLGGKMVEGRSFSKDILADETSSFILNEAAVREFGWESGLGKMFETRRLNFETYNWEPRKGQVVGVVEDFHFESVHNEIVPVVYFIDHTWIDWLSVQINSSNTSETLKYIKDKWDNIGTEARYDLRFYKDDIEALYRSEERFFQLFIIFSGLAIVIACLGILGLASFTAEQRTKEIGIRKVMGASVSGIVGLVNKEFIRLVLVANIIAWPVAWYFMKNWLDNFVYRIDLSVWVFLISAFVAILIALITVSFQALKAANTQPVIALRYE